MGRGRIRTFVDLDAWKNAVRPNTRAFLVESPANPLLEVTAIGAVADHLDDVLRTKDLVKLQVAKGGELSAKEAANAAAEEMGAEVIQVIGRTFTLFRENPELKRGDLPPWRK